jgi:hypothetical protein
MNAGDLTLTFAPAIPWPIIAVLAAIALVLVALTWWTRARGATWRTIAALGLLLALVNPTAVLEDRRPLTDVAVVVVDDSQSQGLGERKQRTEEALAHVQARLGQLKDLEVRVVRAGGSSADGTKLFQAVERAMADIPRSRLAGITLITDGQVHDAPKPPQQGEAARDALPGPIHTLLTGQRNEGDRRLIVENAPAYGIVGKPMSMTLKVDDGPGIANGVARVDIRRDGGEPQTYRLPVGTPQNIDFTLEHGGQSLFEIIVEPGSRELTLDNNRAVVAVSGVRDRLRVLLVTGEPHAGERTWRNLLKSDPAVDLIHFTILRPPEAQDFTPVTELSLIAFPIRELFEVRLHEFDLIIFDRYRRRDVLAQVYLDNIVRYVRAGGALMVAVGPNYSGPGTLFSSPLGQILPGAPTGTQFEQPFKPALTDMGRRHPVTAELPGAGSGQPGSEPSWGRWFRHVDTDPRRGQILMSGVDQRPLLLLDRVGDGRVAQIMSEHIWLWARGFDGGGPQAELLRRIAHWLMKEPELEENDLRASVRGNRVEVMRRSLERDNATVTITSPTNEKQTITLTDTHGGEAVGSIQVEEPGLYHITDGTRVALAVVGPLNPLELSDVRTTDEHLKYAAANTGGQILWVADGLPEIRRVRPGRDAGGREPSGRGWLGFRANGDYVVTGVSQVSLLPGFALFFLALGALLVAWRREGR